jgi:hypothetical protein
MTPSVLGGPLGPQFTPTGRGGFFSGTPEMYGRIPGREMLYGQIAQGAMGSFPSGYDFISRLLSGDPALLQELEAPLRRQFGEQTIPGLAESFTSMGEGAQSSSAYQQQLTQVASNLAQQLAGQRAQLRQTGLQYLLGQTQPALEQRPIDIAPRTPGFLEKLLYGTAGGLAGAGAGFLAGGGPVGAVLGGISGFGAGYGMGANQ